MLPALTHEMACSELRPPNTTATRVFRGVVTPLASRLRGTGTADCAGCRWAACWHAGGDPTLGRQLRGLRRVPAGKRGRGVHETGTARDCMAGSRAPGDDGAPAGRP